MEIDRKRVIAICNDSFYSACARRFELPTFWSVARRSIQLSYAHIPLFYCLTAEFILYDIIENVKGQFQTFTGFQFQTLKNFPIFRVSVKFKE